MKVASSVHDALRKMATAHGVGMGDVLMAACMVLHALDDAALTEALREAAAETARQRVKPAGRPAGRTAKSVARKQR